MKKRKWNFLILALVVLTMSLAGIRPSNAALTNGLVAYYPFNGNTNDESGNLHNGIIVGAPALVPDRSGAANSAYLFNGINDYITVPHDPALEPTVFSISLWFKTTTTSWSTIISSDSGAFPDCNHGFRISFNETSPSGEAFFGIDPSGGCGDGSSIIADNPLNDDAWHHMVSIYDSTNTMSMYIDGVLQASTMVSAYSKGGGAITIGTLHSYNAGFNSYFNGAIDDIHIYNRALTPTEVLQLFNFLPNRTLTISPASGTYVSTQSMDVTLIIGTPSATMTGATATLDGGDVSTKFLNCAVAGTLISGGETHRCGHVRGSFLGTGTHTFSATVTLSDGGVLTDTVTWDVLENTEP